MSYRHGVDESLAAALQSGLQQLAKPWFRLRALRIFRDRTNLTADPGLWPSIERALERSAFFVLVTSPEAAASPWVEREVQWWLDHKNRERILLVLTAGRLPWEPAAPDAGSSADAALPPSLRDLLSEEPRWVDLRWARDRHPPTLADERFRDAVADLAAPLHGRDKDELVGAEIREHRRTRRVVRSVVAVVSLLVILATVSAAVAVRQRAEARSQEQLALGTRLAREATQASEVRRDLGLLLAAQGLSSADIPETRSAMVSALAARPRLEVVLQAADEALATRPTQPRVPLVLRPDGQVAAVVTGPAGQGPQRFAVWDLATRRMLGEPEELGVDVKTLTFSPDGNVLAVALNTHLVAFRLDSDEEAWSVPMADDAVAASALAFSPDGRVLAAGRTDCTVEFQDARTGRLLGSWARREGNRASGLNEVTSLVYSPDGATVVRVCEAGTADSHALDAVRGHLPVVDDSRPGSALLDGELGRGGGVGYDVSAVSPDLSTLALSRPGGLKLWNLAGRREIVLEDGGPQGILRSLAFSGDSQTLAAGADEVRVFRRLDDLGSDPDWVSAGTGPGLGDTVVGLALDREGTRMVTAGGLSSLALWHPNPTQAVGGPFLDHFAASGVDVSANGRTAVTVNGDLRVWDLPSGREIASAALPDQPVGVHLDGSGHLAVVRFQDRVEVWRLSDQLALIRPLDVSVGTVGHAHAADLSPDGQSFAAVGPDGTIRIISTRTAELLRSTKAPPDRPWETIAYAPDGKTLAAAAAGRVRLWMTASMPAAAGRVWPWTASPQRTETVTLDSDRDDLGLDESLLQATRPRDLSFSADGRRLAVRERDGVRVWDVARRREIGPRLDIPDITGAALASDGRMLVTTAAQGLTLWDLTTRTPLGDIPTDKQDDPSMSTGAEQPVVSRDGTLLVLGTDGVFTWTTDPHAWQQTACQAANRTLTRDEWTRFVGTTSYDPRCTPRP